MTYKYLYLPVDKPFEDGCMLIDYDGEVFQYNASSPPVFLSRIKVAEPFIVAMEFNQMRVIGKPSPEAKWLKNGDVIPRPLHSIVVEGENVKIKCPTCDKLH